LVALYTGTITDKAGGSDLSHGCLLAASDMNFKRETLTLPPKGDPVVYLTYRPT
jgi:hypothetical protein